MVVYEKLDIMFPYRVFHYGNRLKLSKKEAEELYFKLHEMLNPLSSDAVLADVTDNDLLLILESISVHILNTEDREKWKELNILYHKLKRD